MTLIELLQLYNNDNDFKTYVDKYARCHRMMTEDVLKHKVVQNYADYLKGAKR